MRCQHSDCQCQEANLQRGEQTFCSEACADRQLSDEYEYSCPCGHGGCVSAQTGREAEPA